MQLQRGLVLYVGLLRCCEGVSSTSCAIQNKYGLLWALASRSSCVVAFTLTVAIHFLALPPRERSEPFLRASHAPDHGPVEALTQVYLLIPVVAFSLASQHLGSVTKRTTRTSRVRSSGFSLLHLPWPRYSITIDSLQVLFP